MRRRLVRRRLEPAEVVGRVLTWLLVFSLAGVLLVAALLVAVAL